jgi:hypothetical protein
MNSDDSQELRRLMLLVLQIEDGDFEKLKSYTSEIQKLTKSIKDEKVTDIDSILQKQSSKGKTGQNILRELKENSSNSKIKTIECITDNQSHDKVLVGSKCQLSNAGVENLEALSEVMFIKANEVMLMKAQQKQSENIYESLFAKSFLNNELSQKYHLLTKNIVESNGMHKLYLMLPPLILRSDEDTIVKMPHIFIVCHKSGPMIPVIQQDKIKDLKNLICKLYSMHSDIYVNSHNVERILSH